jgi:hypothetical protein
MYAIPPNFLVKKIGQTSYEQVIGYLGKKG